MKKLQLSLLLIILSVIWISCEPEEEISPEEEKLEEEIGDNSCLPNSVTINYSYEDMGEIHVGNEEYNVVLSEKDFVERLGTENDNYVNFQYNENSYLSNVSFDYYGNTYTYTAFYDDEKLNSINWNQNTIIDDYDNTQNELVFEVDGIMNTLNFENGLITEYEREGSGYKILINYSNDTFKSRNSKFISYDYALGFEDRLSVFLFFLNDKNNIINSFDLIYEQSPTVYTYQYEYEENEQGYINKIIENPIDELNNYIQINYNCE